MRLKICDICTSLQGGAAQLRQSYGCTPELIHVLTRLPGKYDLVVLFLSGEFYSYEPGSCLPGFIFFPQADMVSPFLDTA